MAGQTEQIAGELAANVLRHARGESPVVLLLMYTAGTLRIEVFDKDPARVPVKRKPALTDVDGRGLIIVEAFSRRWGTRVTDEGKSVWAELDIMPDITWGSVDPEAGREAQP